MTDKPQLHVSMLEQMSKCGVMFQRRFGARFGCWHTEEIIPPSVALVTGIAVHKAVQCDLTCKKDNGHLLHENESAVFAEDEYDRAWSQGVKVDDTETSLIKQKDAGKDQARALSLIHHKQIAPSIVPLAVEEPFVILMKGFPFDLSGKIDVREALTIRDTKTSRAKYAVDAARTLQMAMYSMAHKVLHGRLPREVALDILIKTKVPKAQTVYAVPDDSWTAPLMRRIERATEIIESVKEGKGGFAPCDSSHWQCSKKYCGYAATCKFWSGK